MFDHFYQLMLLTNKQQCPLADYLDFIKKCAHAGISCVQLREKQASFTEQLEFASQLQAILTPLNIPLLVNDNVDLALKSAAAGVHLGQEDGDVTLARRLLGNDKLIGVSVNSLAELEQANTQAINYIGIGAIFPSSNKTDSPHLWGLEELTLAVNIAKHPLIAIGGINLQNAGAVLATGVQGIAAIGAFHETQQPEMITKNLRQLLETC